MVPMLVIFLIQRQSWNNLAGFKPETVGDEKLGMFSLEHGTVQCYSAFRTGWPYSTHAFRVFPIKIGFLLCVVCGSS